MYRQLTVPLTPPPPVRANPIGRMYDDLRAERAATVPFPPGLTNVNLRRASRFASQPLPVLLACYERYGPVFTIRVFHSNDVFMLGPEANHYVTVSHASNFSWRHGFMGDLIPLLGDGLLTIDGEFHRASRKIMLPAFHRERIEAAHAIMAVETKTALDRVEAGAPFDLYRFTRELALRIAMRALFGLDPDRARAGGLNAAHEFEDALGFWAHDYVMQILRGPGSPWRRMVHARKRLDALTTPRSTVAAHSASTGKTSSACSSTPPTRTARRSPSATSATRS